MTVMKIQIGNACVFEFHDPESTVHEGEPQTAEAGIMAG